ncbi:hypothetical protein QBC40DRAFT_294990 [Triangularia verruculosa]|uniref:Zn(2)-C6 fungal-type domain-containing protein n=1 Tax=Triangularia verruculosa TaxID=2587418 RepID=A0AAN6XL11_9PEZI|nr:hypothetical protein QBC40DRAFT_294990 [Triangularia verruculosa]
MAAHYRQHPTVPVGFQPGQGGYAAPPPHHAARMSPLHSDAGSLEGSAGSRRGSSTAVPSPQHQQQQPLPSLNEEGSGDPSTAREGISTQSGQNANGSLSSASGPKPIRRRLRMITSCLECRRRKLKCNKGATCSNCVRFSRECLYLGPKLDEASQIRLTEIKEKVGSLERQFERDVAKRSTGSGVGRGGTSLQQRILADDVEDGFDEERDLQPSSMVALDLTYDDYPDGVGTDDLIDLGIRVGKMRITERIGGLNRPRISEEIQAGLAGSPVATTPASATMPWFNGASQMLGGDGAAEASFDMLPDFLKPGDSYLPPTSGFFFGQSGISPPLEQLLPCSREWGRRLVNRYFEAVHPIARCVHRPSFEALYQSFWDDTAQNWEPRPSVQAVVFAAWFSAAVSLDEMQAQNDFGNTKSEIVAHMKVATETALSKANFLRTTKVEAVQAFVMYMLPLCRDEVSRAHSVLVGAAVRMAECMGLHRDGEAYGLSPLETHVRRLIWHQLCFLDIRTCEAQGPKPAIRREDYDTKLPLNCEETDLTASMTAVPPPADRWTSNMLVLMRFEINEMMRIIWADRRKLETHKTTLTAVLTKIENFRKRMFEKYNLFLNEDVPIQKYAKLVMQLLIYRLHAMVLHPYHSNATSPLPERLNGLLITSGILIIETAIQLESDPRFRDWSWYLGAYQQYQIALLLATEIYYRPQNKECNRIWRCLDYVFNLDPNEGRERKSWMILTEIMGKTSVYMGMRKVRAPTGIARAVPYRQAVKDSPPQTHTAVPAASFPQQQHQVQQLAGGSAHHVLKPDPSLPPLPVNAIPSLSMPMPHASMATYPLSSSAASARVPPFANSPTMFPPQQPAIMPNMVFAGVSNGEALWGFPHMNPGSPETNSDGGSVVGQSHRNGSIAGPGAAINVMDNIDWDTINILFPTDPHTGELSFNSFQADHSVGAHTMGHDHSHPHHQQHPHTQWGPN